MKKDYSARIITLPEAYDMAYKVSRQLSNFPESFDLVEGISRGGLPPARMICDFLNIDMLTSIQIRHYKSGGEEMEKIDIPDPVDIDLKGKKVLIADDVNDSGKTLKAAYEHVYTLEPGIIKTAVLHEKVNTTYNAHYTGAELEEWNWLIYQWAVTEDLLEFLNRDNMLHASEDEAIRHLAEKYNLEIDKPLFKKIVAMKANYFSA